MTLRLVALSVLASVALGATAALACSCVRYANAAAQLEAAEVMFVGRAEETTGRRGDEGMPVVVTRFTVQRTLKGQSAAVRRIKHSVSDGGNCGVTFQRGRTYTIIASSHDGELWTGSCSSLQFPLEDYEHALGLR